MAARDKAIAAAEDAWLDPTNLKPLAADTMPRRALARKADGSPINKTQRNFTDFASHLKQAGGSHLQGYNYELAVGRDNQVIVAVGVGELPDAGC
jgi:hypothetical protein